MVAEIPACQRRRGVASSLHPSQGISALIRGNLPVGRVMLVEVQWFLIPLVLVGLTAALIWGLQREPHRDDVAEEEILADDPPPPTPVTARPFQHLSSTILQDRRYLCSVFGPDVPDLILAFWADGSDERPRLSSFRQIHLPIHEGSLQSLTRSMENEFFEGVVDQGVPERARLVVCYSFIWLPSKGHDLVVESRFAEDQFRHAFYLSDADGKLNRVRLKDDLLEDKYVGAEWLEYRDLLIRVRNGFPPQEIADQFVPWIEHEATCASAHAWLAHLGLMAGAPNGQILGHLALANEWRPDHLLARVTRCRIREGQEGLRPLANSLMEEIALHSDREAQTAFLLAQALCALDQLHAARAVCEALLVEWPRHPGATRLIKLIGQNERGAQT
jgi:hypothetical protein